MKKIILALVLLASLANCKKDNSEPNNGRTTTTTDTTGTGGTGTTPTEQHYRFYWKYKLVGDNTEYSDSGCITQAEMNTKITTIGAYGVVRSVTCIP